MKPLRILGFALTISFLAPLAQAAPTLAASLEPAPFAAPSAPAEDRRADPPPQAEPEHHEPDRSPRTDSGPDAPPVREYRHEDVQPVIEAAPAPDTDDSQDSAPTVYEQPVAPTDDSCGNSAAITNSGHYTMDDLARSAASLDEPYGPTHFSMDDVGGL
jgi:hypothetical protein